MKRTKIVCTIGPASNTPAMLKKMVKAGMNVARLNFSHGTHETHGAVVKMIRSVEKELNTSIGIIQDLQGPRIRVGDLTTDMPVKKGQKIMVVPESAFSDDMKNTIPCQYEELAGDVKKGHHILIADATIDLKITGVKGKTVMTVVEVAGTIKTHKGINVPGASLKAPSITEKDKKDVLFGIAQKVPYVAMSFVKNGQEVKEFREYMMKYTKTPPAIIAKIERPEAIKNINSILAEVDAIMVARGDLGTEMPAEQVPILQKDLIAACIEANKPVIVATQMLESMIYNRRPTRAEVSDVANAVFDHTDATMLSGESAGGMYPLEAVSMMNATIEAAEGSKYNVTGCPPHEPPMEGEEFCSVINGNNIAAIICQKAELETVAALSALRQHVPIFVLAKDVVMRGKLSLYRGVCVFDNIPTLLKQLSMIAKHGKQKTVVVFTKKGYSIESMSSSHLTNLL